MTKPKAAYKANILAVDDYPANLIALQAVLSDDYNLILANSGQEALDLLASRHDIDVILMDLQMPQMDGFEAARRIKMMETCKEIPIIFITAVYREDPFIRKGYQAGAIDYFSKPFDPEILKMKISIYASFRQKADVLKERERHIRETEELLKTGRKLSSILESLPVGVLIADVEGRICQTNGQVSRICKGADHSNPEAYGEILGWWDSQGQMMKQNGGPLARALTAGEVSHNELIRIQCTDGALKTILGSASPLRSLDGHIVGAVVVIQDITESKKIEADLEKRITDLVSLGVELQETVASRH